MFTAALTVLSQAAAFCLAISIVAGAVSFMARRLRMAMLELYLLVRMWREIQRKK